MKLFNSMFFHWKITKIFSAIFLLQIIYADGLKISNLEDIEMKLLPKLLKIISKGNVKLSTGPNEVRHNFDNSIKHYPRNKKDSQSNHDYNYLKKQLYVIKNTKSNNAKYKVHNSKNAISSYKDNTRSNDVHRVYGSLKNQNHDIKESNDIRHRGLIPDIPNYRETPRSNDGRDKVYGLLKNRNHNRRYTKSNGMSYRVNGIPDIPNYRESSRSNDGSINVYNSVNDQGFNKKDTGSNIMTYKVYNPMKNPNDEKPFNNRFNHKVVIKRMIPHGLPSGNYEYNAKYNSYYIPLVRVHGAKPKLVYRTKKDAKKVEKDIFNLIHKYFGTKKTKRYLDYEILDDETKKDAVADSDYNDLDKKDDIDNELLQPFKLEIQKKVAFKGILDDIKSYLNTLRSESEVRKLKYAVLEVIENYSPTLRSLIMKSEEKDNAELTMLHDGNHELEQPAFKPKLKMPHYSFWDYWVYDKPIFLDHCKKGLVQQGNHCIHIPPH